MISRISSHRREASNRLFHHSLGSLDPLSLILEMSEAPSDSSDYGAVAAWHGALIHEYQHWLQCISTTSGLALALLLELREGSMIGALDVRELTFDDVPIVQFAPSRYEKIRRANLTDSKQQAAELWETVEILRRILSGARKGDIDCMLQAGKYPSFKLTSNLIEPMLIDVLQDKQRKDRLRQNWKFWRYFDDTEQGRDKRTLCNVEHRGWGVGARHFLEGGARVNEEFLMGSRLKLGVPYKIGYLFRGVYGVAEEMFYGELGVPSQEKEIAKAWACDAALRGPLPPASPFLAHRKDVSPVMIFSLIVDALRDYPFPSSGSLNIADHEAVRCYIRELERHLDERNHDLSLMLSVCTDMTARILDHLHTESISNHLFNLDTNGFPMPVAPTSRLTFFLAKSADAFRLRKSNPEFFCLPVCYFLQDRERFYELFNSLVPPLISDGSRGIFPTETVEGWSEFFMTSAIQRELLLWLAIGERHGFKAVMEPYLRTAFGQEYGRFVIRMATRGVLGDSALANHLLA